VTATVVMACMQKQPREERLRADFLMEEELTGTAEVVTKRNCKMKK